MRLKGEGRSSLHSCSDKQTLEVHDRALEARYQRRRSPICVDWLCSSRSELFCRRAETGDALTLTCGADPFCEELRLVCVVLSIGRFAGCVQCSSEIDMEACFGSFEGGIELVECVGEDVDGICASEA